MKWGNLSKLLGQVSGTLEEDGWFHAPASGGGVGGSIRRSYQRGALRVNCLDNLDRTNVVQQVFARAALLACIPNASVASLAAGSGVLSSPFPAFESGFCSIWGDNADALSRAYAGTGALKTDFSRTGKRGLKGVLGDLRNSVLRYFLNNFCDGRTQDSWDLFTGRYVPERGRVDGGKVVRQSPSAAAVAAHLASPSPSSLLLRVAVTWIGLSMTLAIMLPRLGGFLWSSPGAPLAGGKSFFMGLIPIPTSKQLVMGGACSLAALLGLGALVLSKGAPAKLAKVLVNRPSFVGREVTRDEKQSWWGMKF